IRIHGSGIRHGRESDRPELSPVPVLPTRVAGTSQRKRMPHREWLGCDGVAGCALWRCIRGRRNSTYRGDDRLVGSSFRDAGLGAGSPLAWNAPWVLVEAQGGGAVVPEHGKTGCCP